jgi:DNA-binding protein Fis
VSGFIGAPSFDQAASNQSQAARILRIGRDALRYKLKKYRIALVTVF